MQPLRSHHRVERSPQGEDAWRLQALSPFDRNLLGSLRTPQSVSDLLRSGACSPSDLESALLRMARFGWVLIHEPSLPSSQEETPADPSSEFEDASELEDLLRRHRMESEEPTEISPLQPLSAPISPLQEAPGRDARLEALGISVRATPYQPQQPEHDPAQLLPFDRQEAETDGLLEALRHPDVAASFQENRPEWAPPSGGLAALLRALGEPVPEGVDVSPDQEEHLRELEPVEPWGGPLLANSPTDPQEEPEKPAFPRLRDQPSDETRPRPHLGALRGSLNKVQQEQAEATAARDRARQHRQQREDELRQVNDRTAVNRKNEERSREGTTLLGLSERLARVKNDRTKDD